MHLQQQGRLAAPPSHLAIDADHGELDQIGRGTLQGRVSTAVRSANPREFGLRLLISGMGRSRPNKVRVTPVRRTSAMVASINFRTPA